MCVDVIVMAAAYKVSYSGAGDCGMSDVYMLKNVGERTPPLGTPVLNRRCVDVYYLNGVNALCPLM